MTVQYTPSMDSGAQIEIHGDVVGGVPDDDDDDDEDTAMETAGAESIPLSE
jgi:hypothetical protein